jgi:hypothetical protein
MWAAENADRIEHHQDRDESGQREPERARTVTVPEPGDRTQLADLEGDAQTDDGPEGAREDAGQAADREGGRASREACRHNITSNAS